jgi:hypothetical protein
MNFFFLWETSGSGVFTFEKMFFLGCWLFRLTEVLFLVFGACWKGHGLKIRAIGFAN